MTRVRTWLLILVALASATAVAAQPAATFPNAFPQYFDSDGNPLSSGTISFFAAGTTTPLTVYSDSTLSTPIGTSLTLDVTGRPSTQIFVPASAFKAVLKDSAAVTIRTADNLAGAAYLAQQAVLPVVQTTTSTGTVNDFALSSQTAPVIILRCNNAADLIFTGFLAPTTAGQRLIVQAVGAGNIFIAHQNAGSAAADRAINFATTGLTPLAAGLGMAEFVADLTTSRWRMVSHEQGAALAVTFAAGSYTGGGSLTWTVGSGDVITQSYYLRGRQMTVVTYLTQTSTSGTANASVILSNALWASFTTAKQTLVLALYNDAGGGIAQGFCESGPTTSGITIQCSKNTGTWSNAAANTTNLQFTMLMEVQ